MVPVGWGIHSEMIGGLLGAMLIGLGLLLLLWGASELVAWAVRARVVDVDGVRGLVERRDELRQHYEQGEDRHAHLRHNLPRRFASDT